MRFLQVSAQPLLAVKAMPKHFSSTVDPHRLQGAREMKFTLVLGLAVISTEPKQGISTGAMNLR